MMALFGLLWLMRIRAEVRKDKRKRCQHQEVDLLLPPPVLFADPKYRAVATSSLDDDSCGLDDNIPPPPPPPLRQNVQIHRSSSIRDGLHYPVRSGFVIRPIAAQSFSRSAQNIPLECTCPGAGRTIRRPAVRFCDDPFGFYSARSGLGQSWNYSSVVSTLPRARPTSRSAHG